MGPDLKNTQIMLVECRRSRRPLGVDILEQLEAKSRALVKEVDGRTLLLGLCSWSGFTEQMAELAEKRNDILLYDWKTMVHQ